MKKTFPDYALEFACIISIFLIFLAFSATSLGDRPYDVHAVAGLAVLALFCLAAAVAHRPPGEFRPAAAPMSGYGRVLVSGAAIALAVWQGYLLIVPALSIPPLETGDMIPIIELGVKTLLNGVNPYSQVWWFPWEMRIVYGPVLWFPYILPTAAGLDLRLLPICCDLMILALPLAAARSLAIAKRPFAAALAAAFSVLFAALLAQGSSCLQTPSYWPLIIVFAWQFLAKRHKTAAFTLGLLIAARVNMLVAALIYLGYMARRHRDRLPVGVGLCSLGAVLPYLAFIKEYRAIAYNSGPFLAYVARDLIWNNAEFLRKTFGAATLLVPLHATWLLPWLQAPGVCALVWLCWKFAKTPRQALSWMALGIAVVTFTHWLPSHTYYYDALVMWVAIALAGIPGLPTPRGRAWRLLAVWVAAPAAIVAFWVFFAGDAATIHVEDPGQAPLLRQGFSSLEYDPNSNIRYSWVDGEEAVVSLPRNSRARASVRILCRAYQGLADGEQRITVLVNGNIVQDNALPAIWTHIVADVPEQYWKIGDNELRIRFDCAVSPAQTGAWADTRRLSAAISSISVEPRNK
ncbi:MAG: hypothetical protein HQK82_11080 [Desulfovibrionaceae bacterium]|nr:hypothetical protein [Desulfovibrionaceae bacterium]